MLNLNITNTKQFEESVFQTSSNLSISDLQLWISETAINGLKNIYSALEDNELLDDEIGSEDLYLLGDVINLLSEIQLKEV
jgi:hypothetical protein